MKNFIIGSILLTGIAGITVYFLAGDPLRKSVRYVTSESKPETYVRSTPPSINVFNSSNKLNSNQCNNVKTQEYTKNPPQPTGGVQAELYGAKKNQPPGSASARTQTQTNDSDSSRPAYLNYKCLNCGKISKLANDSHVEICSHCKSRDLIELPTNTGESPSEMLKNAANSSSNTKLYQVLEQVRQQTNHIKNDN